MLSAESCEAIARSLEFLRAEFRAPARKETDARWQLSSVSEKDGLETAILQNTDAQFTTVRGRMLFPGIKPAQVLRLIHDCVHRTAWDEMLQEGTFVLEYGALNTAMLPECHADIIRLIYKGMMGVSGRDLCLLRAWGEDEDGKCWLVAESTENDAVPVDDKYVRAELRECGYMMIPTSDGCEVVYISQTNFNGWIPSFMQKIIQKQQPESLRKMNDVIQQRLRREKMMGA
eukprot:TRINITY_DN2499_c0_g1_i2.p1 TRINITY_DN2499_c0_g1~~TRINITY_DN2499_c0_g1_i2.p1  ORF type:complete len:231 (+),score=43.78 TRINITY_DN2499_c0_g1_i2:60-752(+)